MVGFILSAIEDIDCVIKSIKSCIFPTKICADLTFFPYKNMQMIHKIKGYICRKYIKSDYGCAEYINYVNQSGY